MMYPALVLFLALLAVYMAWKLAATSKGRSIKRQRFSVRRQRRADQDEPDDTDAY